MKKICPYCQTELPNEASFCPYCARSLAHPRRLRLPWHISARVLLAAAVLVLAAGIAAVLYIQTLPQTLEGMGEITYTDSDGSYQILLNDSLPDRYSPKPQIELDAGGEDSYRFPCCLYVNHKATGTDAGEEFLTKVTSAQVQIEQPDDSPSPVVCSEPVPMDFNKEAALISLIDYSRDSYSPVRILWTLSMKNGDTIELGMELAIRATNTYDYDSTNCDMSDSQSLQALIDRLAEETKEEDIVNLYLPPVTYEEPVVLHSRSFNLIGSQSEEGRTTFTSGIQLRDSPYWISYISDIDFIGDGTGVAISAACTVWAKNCRFEGWKTALLGFGNMWVNATDCTFENNGIGLHWNSTDVTATDSHYTGNIFRGNGFFRDYPFFIYLSLASSNRLPQRPYIVLFIILSLLLVPSTKPLLYSYATAFSTASISRLNPSAKLFSAFTALLLYFSTNKYNKGTFRFLNILRNSFIQQCISQIFGYFS